MAATPAAYGDAPAHSFAACCHRSRARARPAARVHVGGSSTPATRALLAALSSPKAREPHPAHAPRSARRRRALDAHLHVGGPGRTLLLVRRARSASSAPRHSPREQPAALAASRRARRSRRSRVPSHAERRRASLASAVPCSSSGARTPRWTDPAAAGRPTCETRRADASSQSALFVGERERLPPPARARGVRRVAHVTVRPRAARRAAASRVAHRLRRRSPLSERVPPCVRFTGQRSSFRPGGVPSEAHFASSSGSQSRRRPRAMHSQPSSTVPLYPTNCLGIAQGEEGALVRWSASAILGCRGRRGVPSAARDAALSRFDNAARARVAIAPRAAANDDVVVVAPCSPCRKTRAKTSARSLRRAVVRSSSTRAASRREARPARKPGSCASARRRRPPARHLRRHRRVS